MTEERDVLDLYIKMRLKKLPPDLQKIIMAKLNMGSRELGDIAILADLRDRYLWLALKGGHKEAEEVITLYDALWRRFYNQPKLPEGDRRKFYRGYG